MKQQVRSVVYMFLITLFFTSLVSAIKLVSEKKIEANQVEKLQRVIIKVLDIPIKEDLTAEDLSLFFTKRVKNLQAGQRTLYVGYEEDGLTVVGYAFPVGGPGFWGPILGMAGISPDANKLLGLAFYRHMETPGLGGRITQNWFVDQFKDLPLYPIEGDQSIFYLTPVGVQKKANELDAITGATNTSRAVEKFLNQDLDYFLKELWDLIGEKE